MRLLFLIDKQDYGRCTQFFVRDSARSIIIKDHKVAMIHSLKYDYYKFPGGGIEKGEDPIRALIRETREEAGLVIIPETVREYGCVHRIQKSDRDETECFIQDNYYYLCAVEDSAVAQELDAYEAEEAYTLEYMDPATAIAKNRSVSDSPYHPVMFEREARVLELLIAEGILCGVYQKIDKLFRNSGLGEVDLPIMPVTGGFLHRMYRVTAAGKTFAVKHLNPEVMGRPTAASNFAAAEMIEAMLEDAGIPIVPALCLNGKKLQCVDGSYFYVFDWHTGSVTDWYHITPGQCRMAGSILGRMHALDPREGASEEAEESRVDWSGYTQSTLRTDPELGMLLSEHEALLFDAEAELNRARKQLPRLVCVSDEDMDPKNVMWENGRPLVIDLECLGYGNPVSHVLQLALQWSGITTCDLDLNRVRTFFGGYLEAYDNGFRDYDTVFGVAYTWLEWLEYNLRRTLEPGFEEPERAMGRTQVKLTLDRLRYLHSMETEIKRELAQIG